MHGHAVIGMHRFAHVPRPRCELHSQPLPGACRRVLHHQHGCVPDHARGGGCTGASLAFFGTGSSCSASPCPGACCDGALQCTITPSSACPVSLNYFGNGVACSPTNPCLALGSCCDTSDFFGGCRVLSQAACAAGGPS